MSTLSTLTSVANNHRYRALDSLRGVCACMVVLHHVPSFLASTALIKHSYLFVDFFFVLSGFVIATSYAPKLMREYSVGRYMALRFFRVWPLHAFMLAIYFAFEMVFAAGLLGGASREPFEGAFSLQRLLESIFLVGPFFGPDGVPWNGPAWSIATEFWTYLIFAAIVKLWPRWIVSICLATLFISPIILALSSDRNMYVFHDGALIRCLFGFSAGVLLWKLPLHVREFQLGRWGDHALELGAVILCLTFLWFAAASRLSLAAPIMFFIVVAVFSRQRGFLSAVLLTRPLLLLGLLSYSIYMVHWFIIIRFMNVLFAIQKMTGLEVTVQNESRVELSGGVMQNLVVITILMAIIFVAAYLTQRFVERAGQKFGQRVANKLKNH